VIEEAEIQKSLRRDQGCSPKKRSGRNARVAYTAKCWNFLRTIEFFTRVALGFKYNEIVTVN